MPYTTDFSDKNVVVVGGTSGINRGIALAFASHGAKVAVASRKQEKVDDTVAALNAAGAAEAMGCAFDVRDFEATTAGIAQFAEAFGQIDILISGAAGNFPAFAADMSANAFKSVVDIDLMGTIHVMKAAYPHLNKPGASSINFSAPQAYMVYEAQAHVCAAKAGGDQITRCLALEWGPEGVRINSVVPGMIGETEGYKRLAEDLGLTDSIVKSTPLQRLGSVQDVADCCMMLCSAQAGFLTGSVIPVDGGVFQRGAGAFAEQMGDAVRAAMQS